MSDLRKKVIKLAYSRPDLRDDLLPLVTSSVKSASPAAWDAQQYAVAFNQAAYALRGAKRPSAEMVRDVEKMAATYRREYAAGFKYQQDPADLARNLTDLWRSR